jgi:2-hydroxychromene-2-carboxylate isomerase
VPRLTAIYVDFQSPSSFRAWRWLGAASLRGSVEVRPYSLDSDEDGDGEPTSPWDRTTPAWGVELLALGELAREAGGERHLAFIDAAFASVHEHLDDPSSPEAVLALAANAGLDLEEFTADSERWRAEVGLWHQEAQDELGVHDVPCLVFDDEHALLVEFARDVTDPAGALRLLADLADLVEQPVTAVHRTA